MFFWKTKKPGRKRPQKAAPAAAVQSKARQVDIDFQLFMAAMILVVLGLIFMYSSSAFWGDFYKKDSMYFFKRQCLFAGAGFVIMTFLARTYRRLSGLINPTGLLVFTWALLVTVLLCPPVANVHRWIPLKIMNLQPSEFAKISLIFFIAKYLDANKSRIERSVKSLTYPAIMIVITLGLIAAEPDLGTPFLLFLVSLCLLFVGGMSLRVLLIGVAAAVPVLAYQVMKYQYRIKRLMVFMSPEANASAAGYQLNQSFIAIGAGGLFGAGLGASKMKLLYLPEPHTDFIFAILAEELGLIRVLCVIALFCFVIYRGLKIAREADSLSHSMMALGITLQLGFQSFYNMGMSAGLVPTKGIPLPFFSYGGSSIWSTMFMIGILLGISARPVGQAKGRRR